ncbi:PIP5K9 [Symbiodinium necroappetens]|uniref:PIP5K9 protein n=1 Tax=Symbiodinium necroappetens TaxID=1628268 RepID=A0A813BXI2_9DINO|nr:PIP5K9 [Symbiodinium necroappetens]
MAGAARASYDKEILEELGCTVYNPNTDNKERYGDKADDRWLRTFCENLTRIQREKRGFVLQIQQGVAREKSDMQIAEEEMGTNWRIPCIGLFAFPTTIPRGGSNLAELYLALAVERAKKQWEEEGIKDEVEMVSTWFEPLEGDGELRVDDSGRLQGRARCTWPDGAVYEGEWKDGLHHGKGTYTAADGHVFVGEYQNGQQHGKGTFTYASGEVFVGEHQDGKRHGKATFTFADGTVQVGFYDQGEDKGRAVRLSAKRTQAWLFMDGNFEREVSVAEAGALESRERERRVRDPLQARKVATECGLPPLP